MQRRQSFVAAILVMAVIFMGLLGSGCVTKRDIEDVNLRLDRIEAQNAANQKLIQRMDSIITVGEEASTRLRNDVMTTNDQLGQQLSSLLENFNDLQRMIRQMGQRQPVVREAPGSSPGVQTDQNSAACDDAYDSAFVLVRSGGKNLEKAIKAMQDYIQNCPRHTSVANANYWIADCYYSLERFKDAIDQYEYFLKNFPTSPNAIRAMYKLGRSRQELGQKAEAKKAFQQIIDKFPNTLEAEQSRDRLKELR